MQNGANCCKLIGGKGDEMKGGGRARERGDVFRLQGKFKWG